MDLLEVGQPCGLSISFSRITFWHSLFTPFGRRNGRKRISSSRPRNICSNDLAIEGKESFTLRTDEFEWNGGENSERRWLAEAGWMLELF
jgi:hypothetical protein